MKKVISFLLTIIIILSSFMVASAENESVYSSTASNFISFCQSGNSRFLISRNNFFYMQLVSKNKSSVGIQYCVRMCDLLIESGTKPDKQKYREALINIITVHDLDSANSISEQKKLDNLKDLKDYSMDIVSIATDYISLSSFKNPETQKIKESISTAMGALNVLAENTDNWIEAFSDLETVIQNYAYYDEFLKLVEDKAEDKDLSDAAKDLRTSLTRTMEIKLETYSDVSTENFGNYTEYFFTDALFTVAKQVPEYENDETFKSFIDSSGNIVGTVKDSWNLGVSIGTLVGNFVAGGENLINRIFEMEAIHNISVILQDELLDDKYVNSINTENEIDYISRYVTFSEFLLSSRIRGEYCFLSVMSEDAGLLNNFYKSTAEEAKKKYDTKVEALLSARDLLLKIVTVDEIETVETETGELEGSDNNNDYESGRVSFGDYSIVVPDNWVYEQDGNTVYFCEKENYNKGKELGYIAGVVLFIDRTKESHNLYSGMLKSFGSKNGYYYFANRPLDVQVADINNQELINLLHKAQSQINDVINTFEWILDPITMEKLSGEDEENNGVSSLSMLFAHSGVINKNGDLYLWGYNPHGVIGNGTATDIHTPTKVMDNVKYVTLDDYLSGAITKNGDLYMWGYNYCGQVGNGTTTDVYIPTKILSNVRSASISTSSSCAITQNGDLYTWGENNLGQLGDGTNIDKYTPTKILSNVKVASMGCGTSLAITENGDLYMWGYNNYGQVGNGTTTSVYTPTKILSNVKTANISSDSWYDRTSCSAITENGDLYMWGYNGDGQLGDGSNVDKYTPTKILSNVKTTSMGYYTSSAITENGDLYMWGYNSSGQLGDGTTVKKHTPTKIMSNVKAVSLKSNHCGAITENGDLYTWGNNEYGQIGNGTTNNVCTPTKIMSNVEAINFSRRYSSAIMENGDLYMWGYNAYGQLGDGTTTDKHTPTKITLE
ncbi:MAG: hypothetical protein UH239_10135 [Acutalibacteraceae bacterium]|nr:hypothetical protein [Acutalibacteraceae bacterium]